MPTYENSHYDPPTPAKSEAVAYLFGWHFILFLHEIEKSWHLVGQVGDEIPRQERLEGEKNRLINLSSSLTSKSDKLPIFPAILAQALKHYRAACVLGKQDTRTSNMDSYDIKVEREFDLERIIAEERYPFESQAWTDLTDAVDQIHGILSPPSLSRMSLGAGLSTILHPHSFRGESHSLLSAAHDPFGLEQHTDPLWEAYDGLGFMDSNKLSFSFNMSQSDREVWAQEIHSRLIYLYGAVLDSPEFERQDDSVIPAQENEENIQPVTAAVIRNVEVDLGDKCYLLRLSGERSLPIPSEYVKLFGCFAKKILAGSPSEPVAWSELNNSVVHDKNIPSAELIRRACDELRKAKSNIAELLISLLRRICG